MTFSLPSDRGAAADTRPMAGGPNLEHVRDVGGDRRVSEEHGLQVVSGDAGADGHRKYVDGHVGVRPEQVGAENAASAVLNENLEPRAALSPATRVEPLRRVLPARAVLQSLGAGRIVGEPGGSQRGAREGH